MALFTGSTVNLTGGNPLFHPFLSALDGFNGTHFLQPGTFNNPTPAAHPGVGLHDQQLEQLQEIEKKFEELRAVPITSVRSRTRPRQQRPKQQQQQSHQQHQQLFVVPENSVRPDDDPSESAVQETIEKDGKNIQKSLKTDNLNVNSPVTSSLGPIALKNGSVPVVPFYSYPVLSNGTLVQIPILWTAMSVAMGLEVRGEIIRGLPCIKRLNQLFCPTAGNRYPSDSIERFIDENKALIRRMYGEFQTPADLSSATSRRSLNKRQSNFHDDEIFLDDDESDSIFGGGFVSDSANRTRRQAANKNSTNRLDSCESTVEVVTPYWAANSSGKVRAIVNTQHFEQAIHQEVCQKTTTKRCTGDCGCEQKYKWHRLLAYDPDNDCKGIFMDWFLFPSCCVCRCAPLPGQ